MKKLLLLITFLIPIVAFAQPQYTVYQQMITSSVALAPTGTVRNIGQTGHLLLLQFVNNPPNVCAGHVTNVRLEGSYNNIQFTPIGRSIVGVAADANGNLISSTFATGAYPYVRVNVVGFDNVNCRLNGWYTGTLAGLAISNIATTQFRLQDGAGAALATVDAGGGLKVNLGAVANFSTGMVAVPNVAALVTALPTGILSMYCVNITANTVTLTMTDNQAGPITYISAFPIPPNGILIPANFVYSLPILGINWVASAAASINCIITGGQ